MSTPKSKGKEYERQWIIGSLPYFDWQRKFNIIQGFVFADESYLRLRQEDRSRHFLTIKGGTMDNRDEWERRIPAWAFNNLWPKTLERRISKKRHEISIQNQDYSFDIYEGSLQGLVKFEAEFPSMELCQLFTLPTFLTRHFETVVEVTHRKHYKDVYLASHGLPSDHPFS
jgi:CYTH domain-containing protein